MKFIASLMLFVLASPAAYAAHPWTDVVGCYKTISRNGQAVDPQGAQSSIRDVDDLAVISDIKGGKLGGLEMMIIQGYDSAADELKIDYQAALTGRGAYTQAPDSSRHFAFDDWIKFQDMPPMRVKANVSVNWLGRSQLSLKTKRVVVGTGGLYDTNDSYVLEKVECE